MKGVFYSLFIFFSFFLFSLEGDEKNQVATFTPWFTGPIYTPSYLVTPKGDYNFEPYLYFTHYVGSYDNHWHTVHNSYLQVQVQFLTWIGITSFCDLYIAPQVFYTEYGGKKAPAYGDTVISPQFQLYLSSKDSWIPSVLLGCRFNLPTGAYKNLDPEYSTQEGVGTGSYYFGPYLVMGKQIPITETNYLNLRWALVYFYFPMVHNLTGVNSYGGAQNTSGKIKPGNQYQIDIGMEFNLNQNWVLANDIVGIYTSKTKFQGNPGNTADGPATITSSWSAQWSLAPAIEYNFSPNLGIIGGMLFSVAGRNSSKYRSGVLAVNIYW